MKAGLGTACKSFGHKSQFNKWFHTGIQKKIKNIVDIKERNFNFTPGHHRFDDNTHIVIKQSVEPQVLESAVTVGIADLLTDILAQNGSSVAAADAEFPVMGIRSCRLVQIDLIVNRHNNGHSFVIVGFYSTL